MLKRKRSTSPADVDADSTVASTTTAPPTTALSETSALDQRPRLSVSRHPIFPPDAVPDLPLFSSQDSSVLPVFNRLGFRYTPAGLSPPGSALPARTIESIPKCYRASWEDRSPNIKISPDGLNLQGSHGFKSVRTNAPLRQGKWYIEVEILHSGTQPSMAPSDTSQPQHKSQTDQTSHVRLGFARREAPLNGPVGMDAYSYGYRDLTGERVTLARPKSYAKTFGTGDIVGMYISLPPRSPSDAQDPNDPAHVKRERIAIDSKGQEYFESLEYAQTKEMRTLMTTTPSSSGTNKAAASVPTSINFSPKKSATVKNLPERSNRGGPRTRPTPPSTGGSGGAGANPKAESMRLLTKLQDSRIAFFVNGECQGTAFSDVYDYLPLKSSSATRKNKKRTRDGGGLEHKENPFDDGTLGYYPTISLFNDARVRINPGPDFKYPPPDDVDALLDGREPVVTIKVEGNEDSAAAVRRTWRPVCERYGEYMAEQWELDVEDETRAMAELTQRLAEERSQAQKRGADHKKRKDEQRNKRGSAKDATAAAKARVATDSPAPTPVSALASSLGVLGVSNPTSHADSPYYSQAASPAPTPAVPLSGDVDTVIPPYTDHSIVQQLSDPTTGHALPYPKVDVDVYTPSPGPSGEVDPVAPSSEAQTPAAEIFPTGMTENLQYEQNSYITYPHQ
jgi:COMPASS component BRE2